MDTPDREGPRVALVTGASSGIGAATAARLASAGWEVHAAARRRERLERLADESGCVAHALDVRDHDALLALAAALPRVELLVNNAGLGRLDAPLHRSALADVTAQVDTNVTALLVATMAFLPGMVERGRGHVVNVGSMAGLHPLPAAVYGATKGAVHRLSTNLRLELRGTGVRVTEICPGRVATEFYDVAVTDPARRARAKDSGVAEVTADECADAILYAVAAPVHVNVNRIELQPTGQTYGGMQFTPVEPAATTRREVDA